MSKDILRNACLTPKGIIRYVRGGEAAGLCFAYSPSLIVREISQDISHLSKRIAVLIWDDARGHDSWADVLRNVSLPMGI